MKSKRIKNPKSGRQKCKESCDICNSLSSTRWYVSKVPDKTICSSCYGKERRKDLEYAEKRNIDNKKWNRTFNGASKCARDKGTPFELTKEEWELKVVSCFYCDKNITTNSGTRLDRIDNSLGYTNENTVGCCRQCNIAKNNYTLEEFKDWVKIVYTKFFN